MILLVNGPHSTSPHLAPPSHPTLPKHSLVDYIRENSLIITDDKNVHSWTKDKSELELPSSITDTIVARFDLLAPPVRATLMVATALGDVFDAMKLTALMNLEQKDQNAGSRKSKNKVYTTEAVLDSLRGACDQHFLVHKKDKRRAEYAHLWAFKHDTVAQAVRTLIPKERLDKLRAMVLAAQQQVDKEKIKPMMTGFFGQVDEED